jgi:hypothetical protein
MFSTFENVQQAGPTDEAAEVDEAEEAAVEAELRQLRANIAAAKRECHRLRRAAAAASTEARRVTDAEALEEVTAVLANKDNLLDDARIMAHTGKQLEAGRRELERLKVVKAGLVSASEAVQGSDAVREVLRRQAAMEAAPTADLLRLQELLGD